MSASCYLCAKHFNDADVLRHGEHVLQNAIGGALICEGILCEACGGKLGSSVDGAFAAAIAPLGALQSVRCAHCVARATGRGHGRVVARSATPPQH